MISPKWILLKTQYQMTQTLFIILLGLQIWKKPPGDPVSAMKLNIMGNLNVLEACRLKGVKRFAFASSAYAK
ncbi:MAG: NAD-dependent epimerase/dehydratase family protein [Bacteroidota bacterium]|nr:NAD-dependent epimerase/dehydratase family protein [Bacteroidota bacterium]